MDRDSDAVGELVDGHSFAGCPECGGALGYQTLSDAVCRDCGEAFCHEIRGGRHLLWSYTDDHRLNEVVSRAE